MSGPGSCLQLGPVRVLIFAVLLSTSALAQDELSPPPVIATPDAPPVAPPLVEADPTYFQRCFALPGQVWIPSPGGRYYSVSATSTAPLSSFHAATPVGASSTPSSSSSGGGSSGGGGGTLDARAILIVAVVIVAALPVVVYALDDDAPAVVEQRFHCPTFGFDAVGGLELGDAVGGYAGAGSGRFTFGFGYFGSDFQFDLSAGGLTSWSAHLMARIAPKLHIEPNVAVGFRSLAYGGAVRWGLEVGVPHRYVFWRSGLRQTSLELRPTLMFDFAGRFDAGLEAAFLIPLVEPLHLRVGGKVQSFGEAIIGGVNAGLTFTL